MTSTALPSASAPAPAAVETPRAPRGARLRRVLNRTTLNVVLVAIGLLWLLPTVGLLVTSFRTNTDYFSSGWWQGLTHPAALTIQAYKDIIHSSGLVNALVTTVLITVPATLLVVLIASLAAYSLVFLRWRGRDWVFILLVALMVVPLQMALIPVATMYKWIHDTLGLQLFGTVAGVVIYHVAFGLPFAIFLMRNFYAGIPKDLLEAARIDGAGEWMMFRRIVLPLGKPALASLAIFQFLWVWNDLLVSLVFNSGNPNQPFTVFIFSQIRQFGANIEFFSTASFISMVIPLAVFFAFQRSFVRGVLAGAVK
ncbi:MAG TPA: carbohydrate ABC transporter permease [Candidatus Dormibacteraeota bacterium]|jgi:alpha-glucoside transport system permease protein|nr:carbohydrate ABC transporter permease [Candidatus Dormibacteraeota bacterium]